MATGADTAVTVLHCLHNDPDTHMMLAAGAEPAPALRLPPAMLGALQRLLQVAPEPVAMADLVGIVPAGAAGVRSLLEVLLPFGLVSRLL